MEKEIVLITGTSSGFGLLSAIELAKNDFFVIATMRDLNKKDNLLAVAEKMGVQDKIEIFKLDVTKVEEISSLREEVIKNYGKIDILINNAGYCQGGLTEILEQEAWKEQFETNFFSVVNLTKAFLPIMRKRKKGKIINIGSISGRVGFPGIAPYAASKFALEGFSESLRLELMPFNIKVSIVEAGSFKTEIWQKGLENVHTVKEKEYKPIINAIYNSAKQTAKTADDPSKVIQLIVNICRSERPKLRYPIGKGISSFIIVKNLLPWALIEKLVHNSIFSKMK
ncbi:short-subunit dehydrogenase [Evansella vedderi]|uniref:Short-subunit dehydrogenase n=1 Tax=Evansella vedderi TaxID=38282 RepID=A0ABU0A352_9BACI|nr:SDR family oxidoreductase [Evansella vedderi]MDQ0257916.1 short-subunit dehydrogenase [Evansella vedderi]